MSSSNNAPKVSSTFEKVTEVEVTEDGAANAVPQVAAAAVISNLPPMRAPMQSRPSTKPDRLPTKPNAGGDKSTIALGEQDFEPLSSLSASATAQREFSIRRGIVLAGRFRVTKLIGAGAQCFVYAAEHTTLKNQVAIKCLRPELISADLVDRFAREAQALTAIRNAHVAAVLDVGRAPCGTPFIVMEFLQGRDLSELLEGRPRLEPRHATEIALQTCEGLAAAHALGLVHQDIKPSNIFLSDEMGLVKAKVVDFGVARVSVHKSESMRPRFTRSKLDDTVGGTPFYMPPEQFYVDSVIDPRSDIFSLGMVLYEMVRGTNAFDLEMSTRKPGEGVTIERSGIDPGLADVIEKCLALRPDDRYDSVAELAFALLPYAPSRSRSHAEAAAAVLRKAGLLVKTTLNSSIPPPMASGPQMPTVSIPPAAPLPSIVPGPDYAPRRSRTPIYAAVGLVAVAAIGVGAWRFASSGAPAAAESAPPPPATSALPAAIGMAPAQRSSAEPAATPTSLELPANASAATPSATPSGKPIPAWLDAANKRAAAGKAAGAAAPPSAAAPPTAAKPAATSEDLGF